MAENVVMVGEAVGVSGVEGVAHGVQADRNVVGSAAGTSALAAVLAHP